MLFLGCCALAICACDIKKTVFVGKREQKNKDIFLERIYGSRWANYVANHQEIRAGFPTV